MRKSSLFAPCASCFVVLLLGGLSLTPGHTAHAAAPAEPSELLQFTAAGHVLGFQAEGVYVAAGDHMLRVGFAGGSGMAPVSDRMPSADGQAQPLGRVTYADLWPGISLSYEHVAGGVVESSYLLEPGADVGQIRLRYNAPVQIEAGGTLRIEYETGQMRESAPVAWQDINGQRLPVEVTFRPLDSPTHSPVVGFALGRYDPAYPLMIDPTLEWNTFMGSSDDDESRGIAVDGSGNVYVTGHGYATWGSPVNPHAGGRDAFVAKLNSEGALLCNTFMGSSDEDQGEAIALDASGNVYVAGFSRATWGSPVNPHAGGTEAFAAKLNSGCALQWHTFMGSGDLDYGYAIAVDGSGNVYVAGNSGATWGSPVNPHAGWVDAFAAKLDSGGALQWHTFMGSSDEDYSRGIALDLSGNVYVAGFSRATWGSPVHAHAGGTEAFAAKLNSSGALQWHTFMGSSDEDWGRSIALDLSGNVYVAGDSLATWGSPENPHAGGSDAFAAKLNSSGVLQRHTFMGSSDNDRGYGIAVDGGGNVYVAGESGATWGSPVDPHAGWKDVFAAGLNSSFALQWNTFMGSSGYDEAVYAIAVDGSGYVYVAAISDATWGSPVNPHAGNFDAFAAKLASVNPVPALSLGGKLALAVLLLCLGLAGLVARARRGLA